MNIEKNLKRFKSIEFEKIIIEKRIDCYYRKLIKKDLRIAFTENDFINIKNKLRPMPYSTSKVFLFRELILIEKKRKCLK